MSDNKFDQFYNWLTSKHDRKEKNETEKLLLSIKTTSKCRYQASVRLSSYNSFSFFTTTVLSLGLILIPLLQLAGCVSSFPNNLINALQIFLAVSVLVFSIKISSANYAARSIKLNTCGDELKKLEREISIKRQGASELSIEDLDKYMKEYNSITDKYENHIRTDYKQTVFEVKNERITGIKWCSIIFQIISRHVIAYSIPVLLMFFEFVFILDMLGITHFLTIFFNTK